MLTAIIIEDEINAREALKKMISVVNTTIKIIGETGFVEKGVELIKTKKPDIIFLDIKLEDGSGFEILKQIDVSNIKIIFITAYNEYAIQAFKYSAVDYLLKPINPLELEKALKKSSIAIEEKREYQQLLDVLKNNIANKEQKIVLKTTEKRYVLFLKDIIRLEAHGAYTTFVCVNEKFIISKNLKYYQSLLGADFIRCHQSHLVNPIHVTGSDKEFLKLSNKEIIPVATRKRTSVLKLVREL